MKKSLIVAAAMALLSVPALAQYGSSGTQSGGPLGGEARRMGAGGSTGGMASDGMSGGGMMMNRRGSQRMMMNRRGKMSMNRRGSQRMMMNRRGSKMMMANRRGKTMRSRRMMRSNGM